MRTLSNRDSRGNISFDHIHKKRSFQSLHVSCDYDSTKIYGHLSFNLSFVHDHLTLIYFFLFGHDHSTKVRGHSYSLINYFLNCANISFAVVPLYFVRYIPYPYISYTIFMEVLLLYFVRYIHGHMKSFPIVTT